MAAVTCPHCLALLLTAPQQVGEPVPCPRCHQSLPTDLTPLTDDELNQYIDDLKASVSLAPNP